MGYLNINVFPSLRHCNIMNVKWRKKNDERTQSSEWIANNTGYGCNYNCHINGNGRNIE